MCRLADGELAARKFIASYLAHPAGTDHELHVIFKGFPDQHTLTLRQSLFTGLSINPIELEDKGYDVGSYFAAAKLISNSRLIFFNGYTELLADNWLRKFDDTLSLPGVGVVGATGSWQSLSSYYEVLIRLGLDEITRLPVYLPSLLGRTRSEPHSARRMNGSEIRENGNGRHATAFRRGLYLLLRPDWYFLKLYEYGRYPNPHIRTNSFMIERSRFLALDQPSFEHKSGAYKFESGRRSMTRQILAQRLRPVVIDRAGKAYEVAEWKTSSTYWAGRQVNLIAADNRTRQYANGSSELRVRLQDYAWVPPSRWTLKAHRYRIQDDRV